MSNDSTHTEADRLEQRTAPEELQRREIEVTRADVGRTLGRLEDRVSPGRIKDRQLGRLRGRWQTVRESVMGRDDRDGGEWRDRLADSRDAAQDAPERLEDATRGNPLAAGMIALGVGALAGSLLPPSRPERRIASDVREDLEQPLRHELQDSGRELGDRLAERAQDAADEVRSTARDASKRTAEDARAAGGRRPRDPRRHWKNR